MKKITLLKRTFYMLSIPLLSFSFASCAEDEVFDEDELEDAINPPLTWVDDDTQNPDVGVDQFPSFPFFAGAENPAVQGAVIAFPGAEGFGKIATGARGADKIEVYHVTNLNRSGAGSLADAVSKSGRIIVFDVAGVIDLNKGRLVFKSNQTVLFQTAPGDGIEIYNGRVSASGASNLIVRHMRSRVGRQANGADEWDACGVANGKDIIFDHCSFSWGLDEIFSINPDGKGTRPQNITLQNCILSQGCMNHSAGGLVQTNDDEGITIYRNLFADNATRNFKIKGMNQYVNNVVYNWQDGCYIMGGESQGHSLTTIEDNYFITGPCWVWQNMGKEDALAAVKELGTTLDDENYVHHSGGDYYEVLQKKKPTTPFTRGNDGFDTWCVRNFWDKNVNGSLDGFEITQANWTDYMSFTPQFLSGAPAGFYSISNQMTAEEAYHWLMENAGATLPNRDLVDQFVVDEVKTLGQKGTILRNQNVIQQFPLANTWQNINTSSDKPLDTDKDGMPDDFEIKWGLDKANPADAVKIADNGFTNLENYIFSLEFPDEFEQAYQDWLVQ